MTDAAQWSDEAAESRPASTSPVERQMRLGTSVAMGLARGGSLTPAARECARSGRSQSGLWHRKGKKRNDHEASYFWHSPCCTLTVAMEGNNEPHLRTSTGPGLLELVEEDSGVAFTEYIILLFMVTLVGAGSVFLLGLPLVRMYEWGAALTTFPIP